MYRKTLPTPLLLFGLVFLSVFTAFAQKQVPAPKDVIGFTPGDDRKLASWMQIDGYFKKLAVASDRVVYKEIGRTTLDRPFTYALVSSPENLKKLEHYKEINDKLADPRTFKRNDKEAEKLIRQGKTFVLITHGIHSTEVGSTLSSMLIAHRLASSNEKEIRKILDETITVIVPSLNPDGVDIVKDWYDKTLGTEFEGTNPPELYHKYVGHDNNRDWYAFTQIETQMTVEKIHNVYHPQIVHDIHQQGQRGARYFVPPYLDPVEPNVPKEIVEGYTELGRYIAGNMRKDGLQGITTNSIYDAWTPARAYSHYHGGVRILSETASADLASPVEIEFKDMRGSRGFDIEKESETYGPLWKGGRWTLRDITNYMTSGAFHLFTHAAENREDWLRRFYKIGKEATRTRKDGELFAYIIDAENSRHDFILEGVLKDAGVEIDVVGEFTYNGVKYRNGTKVIYTNQPYGSFAKVLLDSQVYPNLLSEDGTPIRPYDVTAHTLSLLMNVRIHPVYAPFEFPKISDGRGSGTGVGVWRPDCKTLNYGIYRSEIPSMDEGWTRWIFEKYKYLMPIEFRCQTYVRINSNANEEVRNNEFGENSSIIFPDQSPEQIREGYKKGSMPEEYTGGLGNEGVENLKKFVTAGGTLVFLNRSSDFAIEEFDLPVENIAKDWENKDFFIPGSILRTELDTKHPIAKGMPEKSIAWFERSPVFEVTDSERVKVVARYPSDAEDILLSGWALGKERIAGKAALVEVTYGRGKIILFGFRPQYRGQSLATFPLLFNSLTR